MLRPRLVRRYVRQINLGLLRGGQLHLGFFRRILQALQCQHIAFQVHSGLALEFGDEKIHERLIKVLAAQEGVAVGGEHFKLGVAFHVGDFNDGNVKGSAAEVKDRDFAVGFFGVVFLVQSVGEGGGGGLVDDAADIESGDASGVLGGLPLRVVEVGGDGHNRLPHFFAEVIFGGFFHFLQDLGGDFLRGHFLPLDLNPGVAVFGLDDLEGREFALLLDFGILKAPTDEALDGEEGVLRIGDGLALGGGAHEGLSVVGVCRHGRGGARAFGVFYDARRAAFHNADAGIRGAEINPDYLGHDCLSPELNLGCERILLVKGELIWVGVLPGNLWGGAAGNSSRALLGFPPAGGFGGLGRFGFGLGGLGRLGGSGSGSAVADADDDISGTQSALVNGVSFSDHGGDGVSGLGGVGGLGDGLMQVGVKGRADVRVDGMDAVGVHDGGEFAQGELHAFAQGLGVFGRGLHGGFQTVADFAHAVGEGLNRVFANVLHLLGGALADVFHFGAQAEILLAEFLRLLAGFFLQVAHALFGILMEFFQRFARGLVVVAGFAGKVLRLLRALANGLQLSANALRQEVHVFIHFRVASGVGVSGAAVGGGMRRLAHAVGAVAAFGMMTTVSGFRRRRRCGHARGFLGGFFLAHGVCFPLSLRGWWFPQTRKKFIMGTMRTGFKGKNGIFLPDKKRHNSRTMSDFCENVEVAVRRLRSGGLVAFPTETVYGLGADARNEAAVAALYRAKGRPREHPVIVHAADFSAAATEWAADIPEVARRLAARFMPGPLTLILPRRLDSPAGPAGGGSGIALRVPAHPAARALLNEFGGPLAAPSANRFGRVSPTLASHVAAEFPEEDILILDGGACAVGLESAVVDCRVPALLRPGSISESDIESAAGVSLLSAPRDVQSPGMLPRHYAPQTPLRLMSAMELREMGGKGNWAVYSGECPAKLSPEKWRCAESDPQARGRNLYRKLRELDALGADGILAEFPPDAPEWRAIRDRLSRAATNRD